MATWTGVSWGWMRSRTALEGELEGSLLTSWEYFMALATCSQVFWWQVFPLHFPFAFKVVGVVAQVSCHLATVWISGMLIKGSSDH